MDETREPLGGLIERMTSRIVNSMVIAAGLVALGLYASGGGDVDVAAADYQIVATSDGRVIRLNTETGSIVSCTSVRCTLVLMRSNDLERVSDADRAAEQRALPSPASAQQNDGTAAGPATPPASQSAPATAQPQR
ncbi:MAG TPA: hypothetical protein VF577_02550 [Allosphingosinicella sp.]|jgi:hypothetical protein